MATTSTNEEIEAVPGAEGESVAPAEAGGRKRLIMIVGGAVGLLLIVGAGLYYTGMLNALLGKNLEAAVASPPKPLVFFDLPDFLVNLNSAGGGRAHFLKLSVSLELEKKADVARIQAVMPRVIDNFQIYLRELRVSDLQGSGGIYRLREQLLARVNAAVAPVKVKDVLFKEMLVQ